MYQFFLVYFQVVVSSPYITNAFTEGLMSRQHVSRLPPQHQVLPSNYESPDRGNYIAQYFEGSALHDLSKFILQKPKPETALSQFFLI